MDYYFIRMIREEHTTSKTEATITKINDDKC